MYRTIYLFAMPLVLLVICVCYSCDPAWDTNTTIYVTNKTDSIYLVHIDYIDSYEEDTSCIVNQATAGQFVDSYCSYGELGAPGPRCMEVWIYNVLDSVYVKIDNCVNANELYSKYITEEYSNMPKRTKMNSSNKCDLNITINISHKIILEMTKNTALTDSVFNY